VYQSGGSHAGVELPLAIAQPGGHPPKHHFFNFIYQAHLQAGHPTRLSIFTNDVTEKVLARRQREAWRVEWQHFFEQAPLAMAVLRGPQHIVELVNAASCALWGRTSQQVLGQPLFEALPEAANQYSQQHLAEALATGEPHITHEQLTTLHRLGRTDKLYLSFVYQPLRDSNNQITGLAVMVTDVSEHVQSRQRVQLLNEELRQVNEELLAANEELHTNNHELAQAKQKLQQLNQELEYRVATGVLEAQQARDAAEQQRRQLARFFQQAPVAICVLDGPELVFELVNPEYQRQFPGRALLGQPLQEALPELVVQPMHKWLRNVYRTGATHEGQEVPIAVPPAEGGPPEQHYFDCVYQARLDEQGRIDGVLVFAHDVTERVLAQQHVKALQTEAQDAAERLAQERETFYQIFEHTPAIVTLMRGPEHRFAYTNRSFERLFPGRQVQNRPLAEALPEIAALGFVAILDRVYQTGESYVTNEQPLTIRQPDGSVLQEMYLNLTYQPYHDNGQTLGVSVFAYNVTEQVLARQQVDQALSDLRISNTQLTRTNADLDTFIYTASHDLKSPIANIEGLLLLLRKQLPAAARQAGIVPRVLDMMQGAVERFQLTIAQLTDLAKLQHAHTQPVEEVDLPAVVEAVRLDLAPLLAEAHAELLVNLDSCSTVSFAPQHLRSIIYNLLSNAIKYRHPHRPLAVQIRCLRAATATMLEVQDNGLGLTPEQQRKLFSMFRRLHDHVPGSGVGLHMVKRIIENAGGTIAVSSQVGVGSIFTVSLPS
jgi:PAS domain S-box-containing protein